MDGYSAAISARTYAPGIARPRPGRLAEFGSRPEWVDPDLIAWLEDDPATWRAKLKGTALARAKRVGLLRNAALVLGARRSPEAVAPLAARLDDDREDPIVRASAAWALGRIAERRCDGSPRVSPG